MKRKSINFIAVLVVLQLCIGLVCSSAVAAEYSSTDVPRELPEWGIMISTLDIADGGMVVDLNVRLDISHSSVGELDAFLIAPDGTRVKLFANVGGDGDDLAGTILDDEASSSITEGSAPFAESYRPEGNLSDFDCTEITGIWMLDIMDYAVPTAGTLNSWGLEIETFHPEDAVVFEDDFPSSTVIIDRTKWTVVEGATIDHLGIGGCNTPGNPSCGGNAICNLSLRLNGNPSGGDSVESVAIDLSYSGYLGAKLTYEYERTGFGNSPESGDDLIIDYHNGSDWVELDRQAGSGNNMTSFKEVTITLPSDALHEAFKLRIRNIGTIGVGINTFDDWFVDDVKIEVNKFEVAGVITTPNFEEGSTSGWTINQAFSSPSWHSNGSHSARIYTLGNTHEADTWLGLSQSIDLSGIGAIKFDATTTASYGGTWEKCKASVCIDDTEVWSDTGENKTWTDVLIDTSGYDGEHILSLRLSFTETDTFDEDLHFDNLRTYLSE